MAQPVTITAWIDFLDPWSWVTTTRLERLAARYGDLVELEWRAFMRYPEKQVRDLDEWRSSTVDWLEPAAAEPGLGFSLWASTNAPPTHSAPALAAALVAGEEDVARAPAYWRALFRAHFTENRTISDGGTLISIAREVGIDEDGFAMGLRGRYTHYVKQVIEEHNAGAKRGVTDTPAVVIGDEFLVRGAATDEQYRELVDQVLEARGVTPPTTAPEPVPTPEPVVAPEPPLGAVEEPAPEPEPVPEPAAEPEPAPEPAPAPAAESEPEPAPAVEPEPEPEPAATEPEPAAVAPEPEPAAAATPEPAALAPEPEPAAAATESEPEPAVTPEPEPAVVAPGSEPAAASESADTPPPEAEPPARAPAKKAAARKTPAKKAAAKRAPAKKAAAKKAPAKRSRAKKAPSKSTPAKKAGARKTPAKQPASPPPTTSPPPTADGPDEVPAPDPTPSVPLSLPGLDVGGSSAPPTPSEA